MLRTEKRASGADDKLPVYRVPRGFVFVSRCFPFVVLASVILPAIFKTFFCFFSLSGSSRLWS